MTPQLLSSLLEWMPPEDLTLAPEPENQAWERLSPFSS